MKKQKPKKPVSKKLTVKDTSSLLREREMEINPKLLGKFVRRVRKMQDMSRKKMSNKTKIEVDRLKLFEADGCKMTKKELTAIAKSLDLPFKCLMVSGVDTKNIKDKAMREFAISLQQTVNAIVKARYALAGK